MMETFSASLAICAGNLPVPGEFPTQRPVTPSFDVFFDLRLNKRLNKQPWGWWFETPPWSLWRHRNGDSGNHRDTGTCLVNQHYQLECWPMPVWMTLSDKNIPCNMNTMWYNISMLQKLTSFHEKKCALVCFEWGQSYCGWHNDLWPVDWGLNLISALDSGKEVISMSDEGFVNKQR